MRQVIVACVFALSLFAWSATAGEFAGVIADSKCKHVDASEQSIRCTETCIKAGVPPVFINTADNSVYKIANPEKLAGHYGRKVKVTGKVQGDTLTVESIQAAGASAS